MKLLIFAALGLLLGVGGGSVMTVLKAKKSFAAFGAQHARVVADSIELAANHAGTSDSTLTADSTHTAVDSTLVSAESSHAAVANAGPAAKHTPADHGPPERAAAKTSTTRDSTTSATEPTRPRAFATVEAHGGTRPNTAVVPPKPPAVVEPPSSGAMKLGKIFGAMPPKDAAKVLEQLNDVEIHEIVSTLPAKIAGGIMQHLPAPRAAAVSKLAMKRGNE